MSKTSRRAAVIAASFALGLSCVGPAAHASLLDDGVADVIPTDLAGGLLGGEGGLPLVGGLLGGEGGALGVLGGDDGGLPLVGGILGEDGVLGGEMLDVVTDTTLSCDAAIPQVLYMLIGEVTEAVCEPFSYGLFGLLGSL